MGARVVYPASSRLVLIFGFPKCVFEVGVLCFSSDFDYSWTSSPSILHHYFFPFSLLWTLFSYILSFLGIYHGLNQCISKSLV